MLLTATLLALFLMSCNHNAGRLTAFTNVNLVPMTDERIIESQTVLVEGSRIIAIGHSDELHVPKNAVVIDGDGYYLMPGLADMHMHTREDWQPMPGCINLKVRVENQRVTFRASKGYACINMCGKDLHSARKAIALPCSSSMINSM